MGLFKVCKFINTQEISAKTSFSPHRLIPWHGPVTEAFTPRMVKMCWEQSNLGPFTRTEKLGSPIHSHGLLTIVHVWCYSRLLGVFWHLLIRILQAIDVPRQLCIAFLVPIYVYCADALWLAPCWTSDDAYFTHATWHLIQRQ